MCNHHHKRRGTSLKNKSAHQKDHHNWSRRNFLSTIGALGSGSLLLNNLAVNTMFGSPLVPLMNSAASDKILLIIRLQGGNDSLNTVIPAAQHSIYATERPTLGLPLNNLHDLGSGWALPKYMINPTNSQTNLSNLNNMWSSGQMAILHSVGYPNSSQSHFDGQRNWSSANGGNVDLNTDWMGRHLEQLFPDYLNNVPNIPPAIHIGTNNDLMFKTGSSNIAYLIQSIEKLNQIISSGELYDTTNLSNCLYGNELSFVRSIANSTQAFTSTIKNAYESSQNNVSYPNTVNWEERYMGEKLSIIARLIKGNLGTKIFMVDMNGFDTHYQQAVAHQHLMEDLAEAISSFYSDLEASGLADQVLTMTISEFGRNIRENGSGGTDHGNAGAMMMFGQGLQQGGFLGTPLDLSAVTLNEDAAIPYQLDYRDIYYTVLKNWLCVDANLLSAVMGGSYNEIPNLIQPCGTVNSCPPNKALGNQTLNGTQTHQSAQLTSSNGTVTNGADVKLKSEGRVRLNSGFKVEQGGKLKVNIENCD